jgi:hypothetical protein
VAPDIRVSAPQLSAFKFHCRATRPGQTRGWQQPATASFLFPLVSLGFLFNRPGH